MADSKLVWMDLEMTGLDPDTDQIIEIATIITDSALNTIVQGPEIVIHCPLERLEKMDDWNREHHKKSGLWEACIASDVDLQKAEETTLDFIKYHLKKGESPLCGNSIWQDRRFLAKLMPTLDSYLHYRIIDVSTIKELGQRWYPRVSKFRKSDQHRALEDIQESIGELKFYREQFFAKSPEK